MDKTEGLRSPDGYGLVVTLFLPKVAQPIDRISSYFYIYFKTIFFLFFKNYSYLGDWSGWGPWTEKHVFWDGHAHDHYVFVYRYTRTYTNLQLLEEAIQCLLR